MGVENKFAASFSDRLGAIAEREHQREAEAANEKYYWSNIENLASDPQALDETQRHRFDRFCRDIGRSPDQVRSDIAAVRRARESEPIISRAADIRRQLGQAEHNVLNPPVLSPQMGRLCLPGYLRARRGELAAAEEEVWRLDEAEGAVADLARRKAPLGRQQVML